MIVSNVSYNIHAIINCFRLFRSVKASIFMLYAMPWCNAHSQNNRFRNKVLHDPIQEIPNHELHMYSENFYIFIILNAYFTSTTATKKNILVLYQSAKMLAWTV